jgi:hypothetical protein
MGLTLPAGIQKYFWGDDLNDLAWPKHRKYIVQTILERGNKEAVRWLFSSTDKTQIKRMLPKLKLSKKSLNFWKIYLT